MHDFFDFLGFIVFWAFVAAIILVPLYLRHREREQMHETLRIAYEKGQPVPPELIEALQSKTPVRPMSTPDRDLRWALVLLGFGLGTALMGYGLYYGLSSGGADVAGSIAGPIVAGCGSIPGLIGLGYLVLWLARRKTPRV
jgi:hypothetical protein